MSWDDGHAERLPPNNTDAEEAIIGSVLLDASLIGRLSEIVSPDDFYRATTGTIYGAMLDLHERDFPIDYLLLLDELERTGKLESVGGGSRLAEYLGVVPTPIHAEYYARVVARCAVMRRLISAGGKVATIGYEAEDVDPLVAVERSVGLIQEVMPTRGTRGPVELKDALSDYMAYMKAVELGDESVNLSVPTGMTDFDRILNGGMQRSDLIIIGARPSMGKTSYCLNVLLNVTARLSGCGLMFSLEMPIEQIVGRLLALESGVDASTIRRGVYDDVQVRRIGLAINSLQKALVYVDDQESLTISQIRDRARKLHQQHALDFIVVDHIQLVQASGRSRDTNRTEQLDEITKQLKGMARELRVPVMALSQLSRAVENRPSKVPELRDLRESGGSEQNADVVAFLYRDSYYHEDSERQGIADVIIAKHRNGATGKISMIWNERTMRFLDVDVGWG